MRLQSSGLSGPGGPVETRKLLQLELALGWGSQLLPLGSTSSFGE